MSTSVPSVWNSSIQLFIWLRRINAERQVSTNYCFGQSVNLPRTFRRRLILVPNLGLFNWSSYEFLMLILVRCVSCSQSHSAHELTSSICWVLRDDAFDYYCCMLTKLITSRWRQLIYSASFFWCSDQNNKEDLSPPPYVQVSDKLAHPTLARTGNGSIHTRDRSVFVN